jgi:hypothetical protein
MLKTVFRIRGILARIRIIGSVPQITVPDTALKFKYLFIHQLVPIYNTLQYTTIQCTKNERYYEWHPKSSPALDPDPTNISQVKIRKFFIRCTGNATGNFSILQNEKN